MTQPTHTTPAKSILPTLAEALRLEADALAKLPCSVSLCSGEHVGSFAGKHYYRFETPELVVFRHLTAMKCVLGTSNPLTLEANVVAIDNQYLTLAFPFTFGPILPEIICTWEYGSSIQPSIEFLSSGGGNHSVLQHLLDPADGTNLHAVSFEPTMLPDTPSDQQKALEKILRNRVSFVWGPILSGKTHLLAHIACNYVKAGKSVLFVATMNERVDDVLLRSIEIGPKLGVDMSGIACCLGLPAVENFERLGHLTFEQQTSRMREEKRKSFQERVLLLETYWDVRIKQVLHEDHLARITDVRERLSEKKKQLEKLTGELLPLKENINRIQNASMIDRLKKGFGKDDLALAQRKLEEKQTAVKRLQSLLTSLTQESLRREAGAPVSGEDMQKFRLAMKRIDELGGLEKVKEAVRQYTAIDEKAVLDTKLVIGTTLVRALSDARVADRTFDMVMVDDAEGIPLPFIAALAKLSKEKMVVCGDPYQLGPESVSTSGVAGEWLKRDIFLHVAQTDRLNALFDFTEKHSDWCILLSSHFATTPKLSLFMGSVVFDEKINVFASPKAKGRIFFIDTSSMRSQSKQYIGKRKILPSNELHARKVVELTKHALMEPGRTATDVGVIVPFPGPSLFIKQQLRMSGVMNVEVGPPQTYRGKRKAAVVFDTVAAGVDHTIRQLDDMKSGEHQIVRLLNTVFSSVAEDLYVLADMNHFQTIYKDRLLTRLLMLLKAQSDPLVNFSLPAKNFDELDWNMRAGVLAYSGEALSMAPTGRRAEASKEDAELAVRMKLMAKKEGSKIEGTRNYELETELAVRRISGLLADINLLSQYVGGELLFHHSLSTEKASAKLPFTVCLSEKEFRQVMEDWNLIVYEMSGGTTAESPLLKHSPETRARGELNTLKAFYSTDVESAMEEGKQKLAVAVSKTFQESLGKPQPGNPTEWVTGYLSFLARLEGFLVWITEQLRK